MPLPHLRQFHAHCAPARGRTVASGRSRPQVLLRLHPVQFADQLVQHRTQRIRRERRRWPHIIVHAGDVARGQSLLGGYASVRRSLTAPGAGPPPRRSPRPWQPPVFGSVRSRADEPGPPALAAGSRLQADWDGLGAQDGVRRLWLGVYPRSGGTARRTAIGGRQFNNRSGSVLNRTQYPSEVITLVVLWRLRYRRTLQDLTEMFLQRGIVLATRLSMSGRRSSHPF